ncbi:PLP-dependent aminotransferase family protein [Ktedonosporobacter rubrisoli]|uniref:PLP-dependent aminotransferase family protein n=1 Tax=Ktedonosporobacter rubrisoli TaxID=2509675 RepID=A0A4P6JIP8_KTERU|nr:PLP-dependent aminotransferase family protein [Ktedonosporobacter rubrisoli]QBD74873.1 PLP-dependent aminotransferase family protein [Ktedonosporobacter rubrisoli]
MNIAQITLSHRQGIPLYRQLVFALAHAIEQGEIQPGEQLPSERALGQHLGISRTTVVTAYQELEAQGLVRRQVGRGTIVCAVAKDPHASFAWQGKVARGALRASDPTLRLLGEISVDPTIISFAAGIAALDLFPSQLFQEITARIWREQAQRVVELGPTDGLLEFRQAVATMMGVRPSQILALSGSQQGIDLIARCLLDPGDSVLLDAPGYLGAIQIFQAAGAHLIGWDSIHADLNELEDLIVRYRPKLLYTTPTFQNPTGHTLSRQTRLRLLELAARYHLPIIEDDPYRDLAFNFKPPPTLLSLDTQHLVIYLGTFSKTLASGLRLGWLAAPESIVNHLALLKGRSDLFTTSLQQLVVTELLRSGIYTQHIKNMQRAYAQRQAAMLGELRRSSPPDLISSFAVQGGLYLWCQLGYGIDARLALQKALQAGVAFLPGEVFYPDGRGQDELRLCFSAIPPSKIVEGVRRLTQALNELRSAPKQEEHLRR